MRSFTLSLVAFAALSAAAIAQPAVDVQPASIDLGRVGPRTVDTAITITNRGDKPLSIAGVAASCGCTVAKVAERELAPGASTRVPVTVDARQKSASFRTQLTVQTNDTAKPSVTVPIGGYVVRAVSAPSVLGPIEGASVGKPHTLSLKVSNSSGADLTLSAPRLLEADGITATVDVESVTLAAGESKEIAVTVTPQRLGVGMGMLTFSTSDAVQSEFAVNVIANVPPASAASK
jgi:hypothetical protein